jgi:adenylate cyclase
VKIPLESLTPCFQGLIPAWLYTCSKDGVPNVAILSHVDYVDSRHVALSFQFFNKSKRNISENPKALVRLYDPDSLQVYALRLRYVRSETEGPTFESMRLRIEAIASHFGLKGIFRLIAADIYEVESLAPAEDETGSRARAADAGRGAGAPPAVPFTMKALQELSDRIQRASGLECLLESVLESLELLFGFRNSMILLAGDRNDRFETLASRGYRQRGVGSEVGFGEGIIGMVAEARKPIRISGMLRQMLYAHAVATSAKERGLRPDDRRIPLPGLANPESQLGIPLLYREELLGVLCIESETPYRFHEEDKTYLEVLGGYIAIAIQNALLRARGEEGEGSETAPIETGPGSEPAAARSGDVARPAPAGTGGAPGGSAGGAGAPAPPGPGGRRHLEIAYYASDECILVDGEYLVRSIPAKILWKILREHRDTGRREFTNRQLRLDKSLNLPEFKDNLESRLILLRRRLEERCPGLRLASSGRGRLMLEPVCELSLIQMP